jgi:hypothetical protein
MSPVKNDSTRLRNAEADAFGRIAPMSVERRLLLGVSVAWCLFGSRRPIQPLGAPSAAVIRDGWVLSESD